MNSIAFTRNIDIERLKVDIYLFLIALKMAFLYVYNNA